MPTLTVLVDQDSTEIVVDTAMLQSARQLFDKMDSDMDQGWTLSRQFLSHPDRLQRCQAVADRLLTALHTGNQASMTLMAAYIIDRLGAVNAVNINTEGEANETYFYDHHNALMS